jgi:hypothetical protein
MNTATEDELKLMEDAARVLGYETRRYTVRDEARIHIFRDGVWRFWNPLEPHRLDFLELFNYFAQVSHIEVVAEATDPHNLSTSGVLVTVPGATCVVAVSPEFSVSQALCLALARAAQKFYVRTQNDDIQCQPAD